MDDQSVKPSAAQIENEIAKQEETFGEQDVETIYDQNGLDGLHGDKDNETDDYMKPLDHDHSHEQSEEVPDLGATNDQIK